MDEEVLSSFVLAPIATETLALGVLTAASNQKGYFPKEHVPQGSEMQQFAETIIHEAERLEQMVKEIVETAVIFIPRGEAHDLNQVIRGALDIIKTSLEEKLIDLKLELSQDLPGLIMDVGNMKRVILQLVANALEAMVPGGELTLKTSVQGDFVELHVKDNGRGIPERILPQIFDTLFSTKPAGPGLGLPIVHRIITQHHGQITIDSQVNVGTTVTIRLPISKSEATNSVS